jgi:hypothetical protein
LSKDLVISEICRQIAGDPLSVLEGLLDVRAGTLVTGTGDFRADPTALSGGGTGTRSSTHVNA